VTWEDKDSAPFSDEVWQRFLEDDEQAIRLAPKEPSARQRAARAGRPVTDDNVAAHAAGFVGEAWQPTAHDAPALLPWQDADSRERRRQMGRVLGALAVLLLFLTAAGRGPNGSSPADGTTPGGVMLQQSEATPSAQPAVTPPPSHTRPGHPTSTAG
jgi:hypothetical protein